MHLGRTLLILGMLVSSVARADDKRADSKSDKAEATRHYELGKRHYNLNEWDEAIAEFKAAYRLFPDPVNLYNIAQAYRLKKGHCADAAQFYANYQREEKNRKLRDSVTKVRKDMEACAKTEKPPDEPPPVPVAPAPVTPQPPPPSPAPIVAGVPPAPPVGDNAMRPLQLPDPDPNRNRRILSYVLLGGGAFMIVLGIGESFKKSDLDNRLSKCDDFGCPGDEDPDVLQDKRDRASVNANAAFGLGVTAIIVGSVVFVISRKPKQDKRVTVIPTRGGAALSWSF